MDGSPLCSQVCCLGPCPLNAPAFSLFVSDFKVLELLDSVSWYSSIWCTDWLVSSTASLSHWKCSMQEEGTKEWLIKRTLSFSSLNTERIFSTKPVRLLVRPLVLFWALSVSATFMPNNAIWTSHLALRQQFHEVKCFKRILGSLISSQFVAMFLLILCKLCLFFPNFLQVTVFVKLLALYDF